MNKWKNFLTIIIILAIATAVFFLFLSPKQDFKSNYSQLKNSWVSQGFNNETLHADFEALTKLPVDSLNSIKMEMQKNVKSGTQADLKNLVTIYSKLINLAILSQTINVKSETLASSDKKLCELLPEYKQLNAQMQKLSTDFSSLSNDIDSFNTKYPDQSKQIELFSMTTQTKTLNENMAAQTQLITFTENECA